MQRNAPYRGENAENWKNMLKRVKKHELYAKRKKCICDFNLEVVL